MERKRPGAVHTTLTAPVQHRPTRPRLPEISPRVAEELRRRQLDWSFAFAYGSWRSFVYKPGSSTSDGPYYGCPCCDHLDSRDDLQRVTETMPLWCRGSLVRLIAPLDRQYRSITWPDPTAPASQPWWWRRVR
jgi:hypothetical protein